MHLGRLNPDLIAWEREMAEHDWADPDLARVAYPGTPWLRITLAALALLTLIAGAVTLGLLIPLS